jgi:hypothetical protein
MIWTVAISILLLGQAPASIAGKVFRAGTNEPTRGARVRLPRIADTLDDWGQSAAEVETDEAGNFFMTDLEPGSYLVVAEKEGFATQLYGARRSSDDWMLETFRGGPLTEYSLGLRATVIKVEPGKSLQNINISMRRAGVISGRVRDVDGHPLVGVKVRMVPDFYNAGGVRLIAPLDKEAETDDRGEFRLFDAAPGRYYIVASPSQSDEGRKYAKNTFYPGVIDFSSAWAVDVTAGAEVRLQDTPLQRQPDTFNLSGRIVDLRAQPDGFDLSVFPRNAGGMMDLDGGEVELKSGPDDTFVARGLAPGPYWVVAYSVDGDDIKVFGLAPADVAGSDIRGVKVPLVDPITVSGHLTIDGKPPADSAASHIRVGLEMKEVPLAYLIVASSHSAKLEDDGGFSIPRLFAGDFRAFATDLPPDMYLKNIRFGGADVLNRPVALTGPTSDSLEIEIGTRGGQLQGVMLDDQGKPVSDAQAVLIPSGEDPHPDLYRAAYSDAAGRYWIRGIAPGDYTLLASQREGEFYFDAQYVRNFIGQGKRIKVVEDSRQTVAIQIIPVR